MRFYIKNKYSEICLQFFPSNKCYIKNGGDKDEALEKLSF
jgi:hypothetical protein